MPELADIVWKGKADVTGKYVGKAIYKNIRSSTDTEVEQVSTRCDNLDPWLTGFRSKQGLS